MPLLSSTVPFVKMHGAGNDFIIIDHREQFFSQQEMVEFARLVCRRSFSVGSDGIVFIETSATCDFKWQFFNSDGSIGEMCGNAARCAARYAYLHGIASTDVKFETVAGIIEAKVSGDHVTLKMTTPHSLQLHTNIINGTSEYEVHTIDTGVPHAVLFKDEMDDKKVHELGRSIRFHESFSPAGTNVNFISVADSVLKIRTYERGVEAETKACGTGATAAAIIAVLTGKASTPVTLQTIGGDNLSVDFNISENNTIYNLTLKGTASLVFKGNLSPDALKKQN